MSLGYWSVVGGMERVWLCDGEVRQKWMWKWTEAYYYMKRQQVRMARQDVRATPALPIAKAKLPRRV